MEGLLQRRGGGGGLWLTVGTRTYKNKPKTIKKMVIGTYTSIIILNVNGLNAPTKRHTLAEWIQKQDPYICCLQETHFRDFPGGTVF